MHVRCPQCHNPMELADDSPLVDLTCPSCGSGFSLLGDETLTHDPGADEKHATEVMQIEAAAGGKTMAGVPILLAAEPK